MSTAARRIHRLIVHGRLEQHGQTFSAVAIAARSEEGFRFRKIVIASLTKHEFQASIRLAEALILGGKGFEFVEGVMQDG